MQRLENGLRRTQATGATGGKTVGHSTRKRVGLKRWHNVRVPGVAVVVPRASGAKGKGYKELVQSVEDDFKLKARGSEPDLRVGDPVEVGVTVVENNRSRTQPFQGTIMAINNRGERTTVRVRRVSNGFGVERVFPLHSPLVSFTPIPQPGEPVVRRSKLYFLRQRRGKSARLKLRFKAREDRKDTATRMKRAEEEAARRAQMEADTDDTTTAETEDGAARDTTAAAAVAADADANAEETNE